MAKWKQFASIPNAVWPTKSMDITYQQYAPEGVPASAEHPVVQ